MPRIKDLTGKKVNKLTVIEDFGLRGVNRSVKWKCLCECGNVVFVESALLSSNRQKSCGCVLKGLTRYVEHGHTRQFKQSPTYNAWANMKQRCTNPTNSKYKNYGLRGIVICDEWINSFENFLRDMGEKPKGLTLERIDVNKGYSKENCCWADSKTQSNNKTNNRFLTYQGKTMTVSQWADYLNINYSTLRMRLHRNYSIERILK